MHKGLRKPQAYPWIYRGFSRILDAQEVSADRAKNRSIEVKVDGKNICHRGHTWMF